MMLGIGLSICAAQRAGNSGPPTVASLNYSQVDTIGGGLDIVVTGTNLVGATVDVGTDGVWTAATVTTTTSTTAAFQAPAKTAFASYDVRVTTALGTATLATSLEYWDPSTVGASCKLFANAPDYAVNAGTGTWTARVGTSPTQAVSPPAASGGAPVFAANGYLDGAALNTLVSSTAGTIFVVANPTNTGAVTETGTTYNNPQIITNAVNGTMTLGFGNLSGVPGFVFAFFDGTSYRGKHTPATAGVMHACVARFTSASLDIAVDGGAAQSAAVAPTGAWNTTTGAARIGGKYDGTSVLLATAKAIAIYNAVLSNGDSTKAYRWAQQKGWVA